MKFLITTTLPLLLVVLTGSSGCNRHSSPTLSDIAHDSSKSVVTIITSDAMGRPLEQGSGFLVTSDGKVVTNYHVIAGADSAMVKFSDGGIYGVEGIIRADKEKDVAVLKLKASEREFAFLPRGDTAQVRVGDEVVAIGSPLGLEGTVSTGVVSAKRTMPGSQIDVFQITAPISPGSSGGALLNAKGEVIGVPFVQVVSGQNLNFAVPITYVSPLIVDAPPKPFPSGSPPVMAKKATPKRVLPLPTEQPPAAAKTAAPALDPSELNGTYSGIWQSTIFAASGAAVMTVTTEGRTVHAEIALTGGQVTRDTLTGDVSEVGGGWSVTLKTAAGDLYATGIFKKGVFEGDYDYVPASDHGRWGLKKD